MDGWKLLFLSKPKPSDRKHEEKPEKKERQERDKRQKKERQEREEREKKERQEREKRDKKERQERDKRDKKERQEQDKREKKGQTFIVESVGLITRPEKANGTVLTKENENLRKAAEELTQCEELANEVCTLRSDLQKANKTIQEKDSEINQLSEDRSSFEDQLKREQEAKEPEELKQCDSDLIAESKDPCNQLSKSKAKSKAKFRPLDRKQQVNISEPAWKDSQEPPKRECVAETPEKIKAKDTQESQEPPKEECVAETPEKSKAERESSKYQDSQDYQGGRDYKKSVDHQDGRESVDHQADRDYKESVDHQDSRDNKESVEADQHSLGNPKSRDSCGKETGNRQKGRKKKKKKKTGKRH